MDVPKGHKKSKTTPTGYIKVRKVLKQWKGSLSEDIIHRKGKIGYESIL